MFLLMLFMSIGGNSVFAQSGKTYVGYCDSKIATSSNGTVIGLTGSNAVVAEAICLPHEVLQKYAGMKLIAVNAGMPESPILPSELTAWVRRSKDGANIASGSTAGVATGWNEIALTSEYTITGEEKELWIGFEFVQQKKMTIISFAGTTNVNGCWIGKNGKYTDYSAKQYGSLAIEAVIEGSGIATHDLAIVSARASKSLVHLNQNATLNITIANNASAEALNPVVECKLNGKHVCRAVYNGTLHQREQQNIIIEVPFKNIDDVLSEEEREGTIDLDIELLWSDGTADQNPDDNISNVCITRSENFYSRRMVVEEGTGAWCGYCVSGIVGMKYMNETYPDKFIGIAVHNGDEYVVADYQLWLTSYFNAYPNCIVNRNKNAISPTSHNLENYILSSDSETDCDISLIAELEGGNIKFHTSTTFLSEQKQSDYRIVFVVCENQLPIEQKNYYSGGSNGEMGGFESQPAIVKMNVDDVARGIYPSPDGMENVIPETIHRLQVYEFDYSVDAPSYSEAENLWAAVLLIDSSTGEIVQAAKSDVQSATGIKDVKTTDSLEKKIYNIQGVRLNKLQRGINIVNGKKVLVN